MASVIKVFYQAGDNNLLLQRGFDDFDVVWGEHVIVRNHEHQTRKYIPWHKINSIIEEDE